MSFLFRVPPYDHQLRIFNATRDLPYRAWWMEMGSGKSPLFVNSWAYWFQEGHIVAAVMFAKKGEYLNWPENLIPDHMPVEIPYEVFVFDAKKAKNKATQAAWAAFLKPSKKLKILVMNVESADTDVGVDFVEDFYEAFEAGGISWNGDESTWLKNLTTVSTRGKASKKNKRAKRMLAMRDRSRYRRIAAGLPNPKSPFDVWGQTLMLTGEPVLGFDNFYAFRNYYGVVKRQYMGPNRPSFDKVVDYQRLDELQAHILKFADIVTKDECLDLPAKIYDKRPIEFTPEQAKLYDQMRDEAMLEIGDNLITAKNVLAQMERLHQIACGQLKTGKDTYLSIPNNRLTTLGDIVEDYDGKLIVWCAYRQNGADVYQHVAKMLGPDAVTRYFGDTSDEDRKWALKSFQDHGHPLRVIVASYAMAYSHTLTEGHLAIYYSNTFNLEHRLQSEDRIHRIGQKEKCLYIDLYVPGTIDEHTMNLLRQKKWLSHEVLGTPVTKWI